MTAAMDIALREAFQRARRSSTCRVILLTGAGASFRSGADLGVPKSAEKPPWDPVPDRWERFRFAYMRDTEQPIVAALPRYAVSVGLDIACLADTPRCEQFLLVVRPSRRAGEPAVAIGRTRGRGRAWQGSCKRSPMIETLRYRPRQAWQFVAAPRHPAAFSPSYAERAFPRAGEGCVKPSFPLAGLDPFPRPPPLSCFLPRDL